MSAERFACSEEYTAPDKNGWYVLYDDYLAEVEELKATIKRLESEVKEAFHKGESRGYQRGKDSGYSWRV